MGQDESRAGDSSSAVSTPDPFNSPNYRTSRSSSETAVLDIDGDGRPRNDSDTSNEKIADGEAAEPRIFEMTWTEIKNKDPGSQGEFRVEYLKRLQSQKVWVPRAMRPPKHQTVVIFDWDDTLLCTSFLNMRHDPSMRQDQPLPPIVDRHLRGIEAADKKLLELAEKLGHTFIITNAMKGWVEHSAQKYVPDLLPVLRRIPVISARAKFEDIHPGEVAKWKVEAFLEIKDQLNSQIITNLISLGDSNFEMDAVHVLGKEFSQALVKTIKFRESPTPEELLKQLELVGQKFERIVENARNLKIGLERKWVGNANQQGAPPQPAQPPPNPTAETS